jgi:hypothetical protein
MTAIRCNRSAAGLGLAVFGFLLGSPVFAQNSEPSELDLLDRAIDRLLNEPERPEEPSPEYVELLEQQILDLRRTLSQVKDILDETMAELAALQEEYAAIRAENEALRSNIRLRYGADGALPNVPMPNRELVESILRDHQAADSRAEQATASGTAPVEEMPAARAASGPLEYRIMEEWGRSPEVAQQLGGNASSLKGMALVVDREADEEAYTQLGRALHTRYRDYDNLNIAVFADDPAAQAFAGTGVIDKDRMRLRLVRHRASGRDSIFVYREGHDIEVKP